MEPTESSMSRLENASPFPNSVGSESIERVNQLEEVFSRYNFVQERKPELAINSMEQRICELITAEQLVIIQGPTGCGKSTQVPQFILNMCKRNGQYCKIAVTQPRRIAAITVAKRVCEERGWPLGSVVGYKVGLDAQVSIVLLKSHFMLTVCSIGHLRKFYHYTKITDRVRICVILLEF